MKVQSPCVDADRDLHITHCAFPTGETKLSAVPVTQIAPSSSVYPTLQYKLMYLTLLHLLLFPVESSIACTPGFDLLSCAVCPQTLLNTHCPFHTTCSRCIQTNIAYPKVGGCMQAHVTCSAINETRYVRLNHIQHELEPLTIRASLLNKLNCTSGGWKYTYRRKDYYITSVTCFIIPSSLQQSPIDIERNLVSYDPALANSTVDFNYVIGDANELHVSPDNHGFQIYMDPDIFAVQSLMTASHLDGEFQLFNVHAHWSDPLNRPNMGSEHLINGVKSAAEIHLVFWNPKYGLFSNAQGKPDGIAVLGVLVNVGAPNVEFGKITDALQRYMPITAPITIEGHELENVDISQLLPDDRNYFTYTGSLTTPNYSSCVEWTVFRTPITISQEQLNVLLSLYNRGNDRTTQPVSSPIKSSFPMSP